jgi:hypothetical protein
MMNVPAEIFAILLKGVLETGQWEVYGWQRR